jgi:hypothetical protein
MTEPFLCARTSDSRIVVVKSPPLVVAESRAQLDRRLLVICAGLCLLVASLPSCGRETFPLSQGHSELRRSWHRQARLFAIDVLHAQAVHYEFTGTVIASPGAPREFFGVPVAGTSYFEWPQDCGAILDSNAGAAVWCELQVRPPSETVGGRSVVRWQAQTYWEEAAPSGPGQRAAFTVVVRVRGTPDPLNSQCVMVTASATIPFRPGVIAQKSELVVCNFDVAR